MNLYIYILPFDHRGSLQTKMFGWAGTLSPAQTAEIAPPNLAPDFARLGEQVVEAERAGADRIHVDVMDGHFVHNLSMGWPIVQSLRRVNQLPLKTHLMISNPDFFLEEFAEAGQFTGGNL
jgi:pentose-5-phosphate-3-epimerase